MSCNSSSLAACPNGFYVGEVVWAKHHHDGMYWPARITFISCHHPYPNLQHPSYSYLVQCFGYIHTNWTADVLPYRPYRDYISRNLLMLYDSQTQIKHQLLHAINQANISENSNHMEVNNSTSFTSSASNLNDNYILTPDSILTTCHNTTSHLTAINEYSLRSDFQYEQTFHNTVLCSHDSCSYSTETSFPATNSISHSNSPYEQVQNHVVNTQTETAQTINSVIIITTKTYSQPSFISHLSMSIHSSVLHIDQLTNYQHPSTSTISYLICFDHFDSTIKQTLNTTILNNLNAHVNYCFLLINAPSHELFTHFYTKVMNKRSILVLHYHSNFDNEPLLLCSGNRRTYEMIRSSILKYLCSQVKYIESAGDEDEQISSTDADLFISQSNNIKNESMIEIPDQILRSQSLLNYQCTTDQMKPMKKSTERRIINTTEEKSPKLKLKQRLAKHKRTSCLSREHGVQNILNS